MAVLEFFLLSVLQLEGISGDQLQFYYAAGDDVVFPCSSASSDSCSSVDWLYNDILNSPTVIKVRNGNVKQGSANAARLSVDSSCSLIISNIVPQDAGRYTCRRGSNKDVGVHLSVLSISPSQPAGDATKDGNMTLQCSLWRYLETRCPENRLIWVNDTGSQLVDEDVTHQQKTGEQIKCVSTLTVKHPSTRYTCQLFEQNSIKIEVHYQPFSTAPTQMYPIYIIGPVAAVGVLLMLAGIVALLIRCRRQTKQSEDQKDSNSDVKNPNHQIHQNAESHSSLTYASIGHLYPNSPLKVKVQEDVVTYSAVKPKMEMDIDPNSLYSCVSKPK
ncbi:uncharacterized protein FYW61_020588 [Anableps anableps]